MTKDNLGNEHWQSDQETIRSLYEQLKALADAEKAARRECDQLRAWALRLAQGVSDTNEVLDSEALMMVRSLVSG